MQFSVLELALLSCVFTVIGALVAGLLIRMLTGNRFVSQQECAARHANDCLMNNQLMIKIDEIKAGQKEFQESVQDKNSILFRMLRALVVYMDISQEQKERILNERADDHDR